VISATVLCVNFFSHHRSYISSQYLYLWLIYKNHVSWGERIDYKVLSLKKSSFSLDMTYYTSVEVCHLFGGTCRYSSSLKVETMFSWETAFRRTARHYIVTCIIDYGRGLMNRIIDHLRVVTTNKYNTIADFHITDHSTLSLLSLLSLVFTW
jgi:hypothetical protein